MASDPNVIANAPPTAPTMSNKGHACRRRRVMGA